jgi:hypothetical protein
VQNAAEDALLAASDDDEAALDVPHNPSRRSGSCWPSDADVGLAGAQRHPDRLHELLPETGFSSTHIESRASVASSSVIPPEYRISAVPGAVPRIAARRSRPTTPGKMVVGHHHVDATAGEDVQGLRGVGRSHRLEPGRLQGAK